MTTAARSPSYHPGDLRQARLTAAATRDPETLSLRELAQGLGVTAASVYRHFDNKQALLDELAARGFEQLRQRFAAAFDPALPPTDGPEAIERLRRLGEAYLSFADDEPALWRLMFGVHAAHYRAAATASGQPSSYDHLPAALLGLKTCGLIPEEPQAADVLFAWSAIHGLAALRLGQVPAARGPVRSVAQDMVQRLVRGLGGDGLWLAGDR